MCQWADSGFSSEMTDKLDSTLKLDCDTSFIEVWVRETISPAVTSTGRERSRE